MRPAMTGQDCGWATGEEDVIRMLYRSEEALKDSDTWMLVDALPAQASSSPVLVLELAAVIYGQALPFSHAPIPS